MKTLHFLIFTFASGATLALEAPKIPSDLLADDEAGREESGVNEFTVPSIAKVFDELEKVAPLAYQSENLKRHEKLPFDRSRIALRLGTLIADGLIAVQTGHSEDIPKIASQLSRYAKSLGAGDRIKKHAGALLDHAKAKDLPALKRALSATQRDVEAELLSLRDPDLSHLISLGGWLEALASAASAVDEKFTPERGLTLFREDIADYYAESLGALNPGISQRPHVIKMRELLQGLRLAMTLEEDQEPTAAQVKEVAEISAQLLEIALK